MTRDEMVKRRETLTGDLSLALSIAKERETGLGPDEECEANVARIEREIADVDALLAASSDLQSALIALDSVLYILDNNAGELEYDGPKEAYRANNALAFARDVLAKHGAAHDECERLRKALIHAREVMEDWGNARRERSVRSRRRADTGRSREGIPGRAWPDRRRPHPAGSEREAVSEINPKGAGKMVVHQSSPDLSALRAENARLREESGTLRRRCDHLREALASIIGLAETEAEQGDMDAVDREAAHRTLDNARATLAKATVPQCSAEQGTKGKWVARCECYAGGLGHSENSGRCTARDFTDPTAKLQFEAAYCDDCRKRCKSDVVAIRTAEKVVKP